MRLYFTNPTGQRFKAVFVMDEATWHCDEARYCDSKESVPEEVLKPILDAESERINQAWSDYLWDEGLGDL